MASKLEKEVMTISIDDLVITDVRGIDHPLVPNTEIFDDDCIYVKESSFAKYCNKDDVNRILTENGINYSSQKRYTKT